MTDKKCPLKRIALAKIEGITELDVMCDLDSCAFFIQTPRSFGCAVTYVAEALVFFAERLVASKRSS